MSALSRRLPTPLAALIALILTNNASYANGWYGSLSAGMGATANGVTQNLSLLTTPAPGVINSYAGNRQATFAGFAGVGAGYQFTINKNIDLDLGLQADYISYDELSGVVSPLVNATSNFDTLNYTLNAESFLLLSQARVLWHWKPNWQPYFSMALGSAWNRLSDYSETAPSGSTALPTTSPFANNTHCDFAYGFGLGFKHPISTHTNIEMGYRFYSAGEGKLGTSSAQNTSDTLRSGTLSAHLVVISLSFA